MADLNALIAQGVQFQQPVDPFAQYAKMQQLEQGQQANMLNRMKMDEYQRGIQEHNALRGLYGAGIDQSSPEFLTKLGAISPTAAQAHQKSMLEAKKTQAEIAKAQEDVRTSQNKALGQGLLIALKDPSDAGLDQAFGLLDAQKIDTKPFRAQFAQIADPAARKSLIQQYVTGTEEGRKALEFVQPKPEKIDLGGKVVTIDINPNSPTFKKQITEAAKTMTEYEKGHLATQQSQAATAAARLKFERENPGLEIKELADGSLVGINKRTGASTPITGANGKPVAGAAKPLTEGQGSSVAYGMRMAEADKILKDLEGKGSKDTGLLRAGVSGTVGAIPLIGESMSKGVDNVFNALPSIMGGLSPEQQKTMQARINFITAVLRKESGASISPSEFATAEKNYFPAPGEGADVLKQKQKARETAIKAMKVQAGPGAGEIDKHVSNGSNDGWSVVK